MKTNPLTAFLSSICLWTVVIPISNLSAADDPLDWVRPAVPAPDADGWITLFDGSLLHGCEQDSIRSRMDRIGVSNGYLWLDNTSVRFNVNARNMALRAIVKKVSGQNLMLECRRSQGQGYAAYFNGGGAQKGSFGMGMFTPQWRDLTAEKASRNFPEYFQMELGVRDSLITLKAEEETLNAIENRAVDGAGAVAISTLHGKSHVKKIQVKILDAPPPPLPWTSSEGKTIQAEFVRLQGESVVVRKDGKELPIPLTKLSLESRNQARKMAGSSPAAASPIAASPVAATPVASPPPTGIPDHPGIPKPGAWKTANSTGLPKPGIDRVFLINRGWLGGQLLGVDPSSVTMQSGGDTLHLPRNQVEPGCSIRLLQSGKADQRPGDSSPGGDGRPGRMRDPSFYSRSADPQRPQATAVGGRWGCR